MKIGTAHFVSKRHAIRYYRNYNYEGDDGTAAVERKLAEGSIHIGKPALKPGERLLTIDNGTRYAVEWDE